MLVKKITVGFVVQTFDTELRRFTGQEFVAGNEVAYEDEKGEAMDKNLLQLDGKEAYLPFDMVQPEPPRACLRVEWAPDYFGGDYGKVGRFAHVPLDAIGAVPGSLTGDERVRAAFNILTGIDPAHIVHYTFDEVFDQHGNEWREDEP